MIKKTLVILLFLSFGAKAQEGNLSFGLQFKPIVPAAYFDDGLTTTQENNFIIDLSPRFGHSVGMVVRKQISNTFSFETGLNYVQRNYRLTISNKDISLNDENLFGIRSYEWPIQLLSYVRINKNWYLNASFGNSINTFTSDVLSVGENNPYFSQSTAIRRKIQSALIANLGAEVRTNDKGIFYFGLSLHRPWKIAARVYPRYDDGQLQYNQNAPSINANYIELNGNYLTIDLRYFFKTK